MFQVIQVKDSYFLQKLINSLLDFFQNCLLHLQKWIKTNPLIAHTFIQRSDVRLVFGALDFYFIFSAWNKVTNWEVYFHLELRLNCSNWENACPAF